MEDSYLKRAENRSELLRMTPAELEKAAEEIRTRLITTVAANGGHLASNLGMVEATLAIHRSFDPMADRIIWDVGHQSYVHKLLTGRDSRFDTLRQLDGLSGFPKKAESETDAFETGHSTTSISAALGMARARDLKGEKHHVVAVIGDGSLTGGMAWEAMNDAGQRREKLIVILNDNEMSISRNVGAISSHLAALRTRRSYTSFKHWVRDHISPIPLVGKPLYRGLSKLRDRTKYSIINSRGILFEEMGWSYIGPIDGHDISRLEEVLQEVKQLDKPVIVHISTSKGKGYSPAEKAPERFHGVGPFNIETGEPLYVPHGCAEALGHALTAKAWEDPRIVAVTAAMPDGCGLTEFREKFPRRYFDVAIAEQHAVTVAAGMAAGGLKPVVCIYSTFLQRAYDQILEDVCMQKLPVVFCISHSGISGRDGETHQGIFTMSYLRGIPNLTVLMAADKAEIKSMLRWALEQNGPVALCYPKNAPEGVTRNEWQPGWEKAAGKENAGIAVLAAGITVHEAVMAAEGLNAEVWNCSSLKPLDEDRLSEIAERCRRIVTVEDMVPDGGLGETVADWLETHSKTVPLTALRLPDGFVPHGSPAELLHRYGLDAEGIAGAIREEEK